MSRRHGFLYAALKASQAAQRQLDATQRRQAAALARAERDRARQSRHAVALNKQLQRETEREHVRQQEEEVESLNSDLEERVQDLTELLAVGLSSAGALDFDTLKRTPEEPPFQPGKLAVREPGPSVDRYTPPPLTGLYKFLPSTKRIHAEATELGLRRFEEDVEKHTAHEAAREKALVEARAAHRQEVDRLKRDAGDWNA